jgi:thymidylate synthase (FAD)
MNEIRCLDKGYIAYERHMGDDLAVVNDLRASFMKRSKWIEEDDGERTRRYLAEKDVRLLRYCFERREFAAWRHSVLVVEIKAPLMVARQLHKYSVASLHREDQFGWNEASRRYVSLGIEFYEPHEWRSAPTNGAKQGSGGVVSQELQIKHGRQFDLHASESLRLYEDALADGVCVEQARGYLPAYFLYTTWHWTLSVNAILHVLMERIPHDAHAQFETWVYAVALMEIMRTHWPITVGALSDYFRETGAYVNALLPASTPTPTAPG